VRSASSRGSGDGTPHDAYCGGCGVEPVKVSCSGSLRRRGIDKAHWECWSECNLECPFCFRTDGEPLGTKDAVLLLRALSTGALRAVVFAGGDPSLRRDLADLVSEALALGLEVQVQTNGQHVTSSFLDTLLRCEYVGLSLDGPDPATHDRFRGKRGNFKQVMAFLGQLDRLDVPVSVRTVVGYPNYRTVPEIASIILQHSNVICWKLLEFTAVGNGFVNRGRYGLPSDVFERTVLQARARLEGSAGLLEVLRNVDKVGIYMMISAGGMVYGVTEAALTQTGHHRYVGSVLSDHLDHLAERLPYTGRDRPARSQIPAEIGILPAS
jgi:MoaA/NifB/PqqE/SkfB family radical SAM enzyme